MPATSANYHNAANHTARPTPSRLIGTAEVMQRMAISNTTLWRLVKANKIPTPRKLGKLNRWLEADIERYIAQATMPTTTP